jgi:thymidine kinase
MSGHLEVITGPMYAGKSEELMRRLRRAEIAHQKTVVFKPTIDNRYGAGVVSSHIGNQWSAYSVKDAYQAWDILQEGNENYDVIAIDEIQFFDDDITGVVFGLLEQGKRVIVSGLDMDFRKDPFSVMPDLLAIAKFIVKLRAVCQTCGEDAMYTQRLVDGNPAPLDGETVIVGGTEQYEARCENCWEAG